MTPLLVLFTVFSKTAKDQINEQENQPAEIRYEQHQELAAAWSLCFCLEMGEISPFPFLSLFTVATVRLFREQYQLVAEGGGVFGRIDALNGLGDELDDGDFLEQVDLRNRENRVQTGRQFRFEQRSADPGAPTAAAGQEAILLSRIEIADLEKAATRMPQVDVGTSRAPFSGIDFLNGFGSVEGPYPKWALPVVIWGRGDASRIGIAGEIGAGMLVIEWKPGAAVQAIDVLYQDKTIGHCVATVQNDAFRSCQIDFPGGATASDLVLRYVGDKEVLPNKMNNSALYKRIAIVGKK